ncbi:MAG: PGPGW domain-containing protein [Syntrophobacteria bacterium]
MTNTYENAQMPIKRILRYIIGTAFLAFGVVGLFLPVLQGILFILIGLSLLFPRNRQLRRLLAKARSRYPRQAARFDAFKQQLATAVRRKG